MINKIGKIKNRKIKVKSGCRSLRTYLAMGVIMGATAGAALSSIPVYNNENKTLTETTYKAISDNSYIFKNISEGAMSRNLTNLYIDIAGGSVAEADRTELFQDTLTGSADSVVLNYFADKLGFDSVEDLKANEIDNAKDNRVLLTAVCGLLGMTGALSFYGVNKKDADLKEEAKIMARAKNDKDLNLKKGKKDVVADVVDEIVL